MSDWSANSCPSRTCVGQLAVLLPGAVDVVAHRVEVVVEGVDRDPVDHGGPHHDPHPEGEEDGDEGHDVVPEVDHRSVRQVSWRLNHRALTKTCRGWATATIMSMANRAAATRKPEVAGADPALVEPAHPLGVHQDGPHLQPHEEGGRHPRPPLVEELHHGGVGADGHDQLGPLLVGEEHGHVLAGAGGLEGGVGQAQLLEASGPGRVAAPEGVHHQLGVALEGLGGHRVEVADDDVGPVAGLQHRVGAAVDGDDDGADLVDVGPQGLEVGPGVGAAPHHHEDVAAGDVDLEVGQDGRLGEEVAFLAEVLERVLGEGLQLDVDRLLGHLDLGLERLQAVAGAGGHHLPVADDVAPVDPQGVALADAVHHLGADLVDERDAGRGQQEGAEVGVAAGDGAGRVHHRRRLGPDEPLGRHPVEVLVVDDGDLARLEAGDEVLGAAVDPGPAGGHARGLGGGGPPAVAGTGAVGVGRDHAWRSRGARRARGSARVSGGRSAGASGGRSAVGRAISAPAPGTRWPAAPGRGRGRWRSTAGPTACGTAPPPAGGRRGRGRRPPSARRARPW